jgi:hypothetical protein
MYSKYEILVNKETGKRLATFPVGAEFTIIKPIAKLIANP